jgi:hypothetical protein
MIRTELVDDEKPIYIVHDAILTTTLKNPLGVSLGSILRPKTKYIQEEFNGLSQETWVKKIQIC